MKRRGLLIVIAAVLSLPSHHVFAEALIPYDPYAPFESKIQKFSPLANLIPGKLFQFKVPLTEKEKVVAATGGNTPPFEATVGLVVPSYFKPSGVYPVIIVFGIPEGSGMHIPRMFPFIETAARKGWVVMAVDGPAKPQYHTKEWVWTMLSAGLRSLQKEWPGFEKWPLTCTGNSGGGVLAAQMASKLSAEGYEVIGLFLRDCKESNVAEMISAFDRPPAEFKKLRIHITTVDRAGFHNRGLSNVIKNSSLSKSCRGYRVGAPRTVGVLDPWQVTMALDWMEWQNIEAAF